MQSLRRGLAFYISLIGGGFLVAGVALWWFSNDIQSLAEKVVAERSRIERRAGAIEILASLKRDAPATEEYRRAIDLVLPSRDQLLDFPRWLEGVARAHRLDVDFRFQGAQVAAGENVPGYVGFWMRTGGKLEEIVAFLKGLELENSRFLVSLDAFDIKEAAGNYELMSQGRVFFR